MKKQIIALLLTGTVTFFSAPLAAETARDIMLRLDKESRESFPVIHSKSEAFYL